MALNGLSLVLILQLATLSSAYKIFETNCTTPSKQYQYVTSPDNRGTLDILWSCLFTVVACTWTVQHLNVPEQREGRDPGILGGIKWALKRMGRSVKWMITTVLAPEILIGKNLGDLRIAKRDIKELQRFAANDGVPWTITHSLFANMGGFVIRSHKKERYVRNKAEAGAKERTSIVDSTSAEAALKPNGSSNKSHQNPFHLTAPDILALRRSGHLTELPYITKEEINDKSESDTFVRIIAVVQILWMVLQIIVRAVRHLAISQLEISVVAFAFCAIVLYGLNWEKPKNPEVPITLVWYSGAFPSDIILNVRQRHDKNESHGGFVDMAASIVGEYFLEDQDAYDQSLGSCRRNHILIYESGAEKLGILLGSVVFGSVHLIASEFVFPTTIERTLWRVAGVYCTALGLVWILIIVIELIISGLSGREDFDWFSENSIYLAIPIYIIARLFLIVEMFRSLCFLPPDAFIGTFASNIPHVA